MDTVRDFPSRVANAGFRIAVYLAFRSSSRGISFLGSTISKKHQHILGPSGLSFITFVKENVKTNPLIISCLALFC
jgi:hypothetical protein